MPPEPQVSCFKQALIQIYAVFCILFDFNSFIPGIQNVMVLVVIEQEIALIY